MKKDLKQQEKLVDKLKKPNNDKPQDNLTWEGNTTITTRRRQHENRLALGHRKPPPRLRPLKIIC